MQTMKIEVELLFDSDQPINRVALHAAVAAVLAQAKHEIPPRHHPLVTEIRLRSNPQEDS